MANLIFSIINTVLLTALIIGVWLDSYKYKRDFRCSEGHEKSEGPFCSECGRTVQKMPVPRCGNSHKMSRYENYCHKCGSKKVER